MNALNDMTAGRSSTGRVGPGMRVAIYCGQPLDSVAVCATAGAQRVISEDPKCRQVEVPTKARDRVRFLKQWAREQRRRALAGGAWSLLILPVFASAAAAQSEGAADGIVSAAVQPDGSLLVSSEDGSTVLVPEGEYSITADGQYLIEADALAGVSAAGQGALVAVGAALAGGVALAGGGSDNGAGGGGGSVADDDEECSEG